jgi:hypothetical protein
MAKTVSERHQRSKIITASNVIGTTMLCIFLVAKIFFPQKSLQNSSTPSLIDSVALLVVGLSISVSMAQYGYQAWLLDLHSFTEWYSYQQIISNTGFQEWYNSLRGWNLRSQYRLIGPIGFLAGLAMAALGLVMIVAPLLAD